MKQQKKIINFDTYAYHRKFHRAARCTKIEPNCTVTMITNDVEEIWGKGQKKKLEGKKIRSSNY